MKFNIKNLIRKNIDMLNPYQSARKIGGQGNIFLNANEYPSSIKFQLSSQILNRYPECQPKNLIEKYSNYIHLNTDQILVTRGADESIELLMRAFCNPGTDAILICPPTYGMYSVCAEILGIECKEVNLLLNWQLNLPEIKKKLDHIKLIYICRPNNPTGNLIKLKDICTLLDISRNKLLIIVDEAYIEFCMQSTLIQLLNDYPNLIILRTLSKAFGLAGLRCGFTLANKVVIEILNKIIAPYPISIPTSNIAVKFLTKNKIKNMQQNVMKIHNNRIWLSLMLNNCKCVEKVFDSETNYVLVRFVNSQQIFQKLLHHGIVLRDQNHSVNLHDCLRISVGTFTECATLINILNNICEK